jgi:hypothetical protein
MPDFFKVLVRGISQGQEINNTLYYGDLVPGTITFSTSDAEDLGQAVNAAWKTNVLPLISSQYAFQGCDVSVVDENGEIRSPFVVSVSDTGAGADATAIDGPGRVFIAKFNCTPVAEASGHPVPRRSYVAIGPITGTNIGTTGILTNQATLQAAVATALTGSHLVGLGPVYPYRVGRTVAPSTADPNGVTAGVGRVNSLIVRPYSSFRRSRMASPTGN